MITLLIVAAFFLIVVCLADWKRPSDKDSDMNDYDEWLSQWNDKDGIPDYEQWKRQR